MPTDLSAPSRAGLTASGLAADLLADAVPGWRVETHGQLRSTQDTMRERLEAGVDVHGLVIRALTQSGGRGQRARDWHSGHGGSWQTAAVHDPEGQLARSPVTLAIGVGLCSVFTQAGVTLRVKWPNDLLADNRKVAGILCESVQGHLFAGVGVNVHNSVPDDAAALPLLPSGYALQLEQVHELVLAGICAGLCLASASADSLPAAFAAVDALAGWQVEVLQGTQVLQGTALGIAADGSLQLRTDSPFAAARDAAIPGETGGVISVRSGRVRLLPNRARDG